MRRELKKRGVTSLKVVYSQEEPIAVLDQASRGAEGDPQAARRVLPGSVAYVPSVAGLIIASEVVKDLAAGSQGGAG